MDRDSVHCVNIRDDYKIINMEIVFVEFRKKKKKKDLEIF